MFASALSAVILGLEALPIQVEADVSDGLPSFVMVGFPSAQVREAQDRVRTALKNNGIFLPPKRVTVNFAPADIRKEGAGFDLPVAAAVLAASGYLSQKDLAGVMILGELSLNGEVYAAGGVLPRVLKARETGCRYCLIPRQNLAEARLVPGILSIGVTSLMQMIECLEDPEVFLEKEGKGEQIDSQFLPPGNLEKPDFQDVCGQESAKRAAEISAAGFHNLLMTGPPGSGKTMIARRIPTILPALSFEESLEVTRIYSIAGLLSQDNPLITERPFRSPHHTSTPQALAGGGRIPVPGEITLAHFGVLFLDEMAEFSRNTLEILRQPLEDRVICLSRASGTFLFPANFMLVAAMNPCPCGYYPDMQRCRCTPGQVSHYVGKISQPLLDRMDLCTQVNGISFHQISAGNSGESSARIRERVEKTRQLQADRYQKEGFHFNAELKGRDVEKYCCMTAEAGRLLQSAFEKLDFSARSYHRLLKVSRTIADMEGEEIISSSHMSEALSYRMYEKK
ncbi:MAG: YifB family Mg chelatase-like AAA ATPase [Blautia sp.]|nr:YifB family Mg chelatase-like AAA ATPase [Blautia sp.]